MKKPLNGVIELVNKAIRAINEIHVDIPDWVPLVGGKSFGFNFNEIPLLAKGTRNFKGGAAVINEMGGEIVNLPRGAQVIPHDESVRAAVGLGQRLAERRIEGRLVDLTAVLKERRAAALPTLSAVAAAPVQTTKAGTGKVEKHITIAKIADTVIIREQADADALAETIAKRLEELDENCA